ncbi:MAG: serpin family protein [Thermoguttaceae bacterium]|jgi:serpin B
MSKKHIPIVVLLATFAVVYTEFYATVSGAAEAKPDAQALAVVQGNNALAFDLYAKLRTENEGNLFLSPYSISTALAMTYAGAKGKTAAEMAEVLRFTVPQEQLHPAFAALAAKLHGDVKKEGYQLRIANRLWGQVGYHFLPKFLQATRDYYGAELAQVDFAQDTEAARHTINTWVAENTEEKIKDLIAKGVLNPLTRLVLTNAIYFKGDWQSKFEAKATKDAPFLLTPQEKVNVPMMHQMGMFHYGVVDEVQVLELPYVGKDLSMFVLLPKEVDGLADLEKNLSAKNLSIWISGLREQEVTVLLPRFKMISGFRLEQVLGSMGMPQAFSGEADFAGMTGKRELSISAVIHKAFIDVNEEGTEAAAATAVVMARPSPPKQNPTFRADHPFLFLIRDNRSGSILFLGRMANPKG